MRERNELKPFDLRTGFLITFTCLLIVYTPLITELLGRLLQSIGFWDKLKNLPNLFQTLLVISMFIGLGIIVNCVKDLVKYMIDLLFGKDETINSHYT